MYFEELLAIVGDESVFETGLLLAGNVNPGYVRRQLSDWVQTGKLWQLRRGLYMLAPPYQKVRPHPFVAANHLVSGSYVSSQAALAYYGHIPEYTPVITSVTTRRPGEWQTSLGQFTYRHIQSDLFFGYEYVQVDDRQFAFVATPAKALLDLIYLQPGGDSEAFIESLRLQNLDRFDVDQVKRVAGQTGKPKLYRAARRIARLAVAEAEDYQTL